MGTAADRHSWGRKGMTLVELMVAIAITGVIMTISISVFLAQFNSYNRSQGAKATQMDSQVPIEMLKEDLSLAGWGVLPKMAFLIEDGGSAGTDRIYVNDVSVLSPTNLSSLEAMVDTDCAACAHKDATTGTTVYVNGTMAVNAFATEGPALWWTGSNYVRSLRCKGGGEFNNSTLSGMVTPAVEYCADGGNNTHCPTNTAPTVGKTWALWKYTRSTSGQMVALSDDVADVQVSYRTRSGTGYCNGNGTTACPMPAFNASSVQWVTLAVVTRSRDKTRPETDPSSCRPAVFNHAGAASGDATQCGYEYRTYMTTVGPIGNLKR